MINVGGSTRGTLSKSVIWYDVADWDWEPDRKLKFPTFENPRWLTAAILKNGKAAIEQYLLMRRHVPVKSAIHRVGKNRIICRPVNLAII